MQTIPKIKRRNQQYGSIRKPDPPQKDSEEEEEEENHVPQETEKNLVNNQQTMSYPPHMLRALVLEFFTSLEVESSLGKKLDWQTTLPTTSLAT